MKTVILAAATLASILSAPQARALDLAGLQAKLASIPQAEKKSQALGGLAHKADAAYDAARAEQESLSIVTGIDASEIIHSTPQALAPGCKLSSETPTMANPPDNLGVKVTLTDASGKTATNWAYRNTAEQSGPYLRIRSAEMILLIATSGPKAGSIVAARVPDQGGQFAADCEVQP